MAELFMFTSSDDSESESLDLDNKRFKEIFRLKKESFIEVFNLIKEDLDSSNHRSSRTSSQHRFAAVIRFYATGGYQRGIGEEYLCSMSQSAVSQAIMETTMLLQAKLCPLWTKFPKSEGEKTAIKEEFYSKTGFPGVIGCIDCTHVYMLAPAKDKHLYVDRFGLHSMNVQLICDYKLRILSVVSRFPGSTHDAAIWQISMDKAVMRRSWEIGNRNSWLLGDSGYPLQPWLMTPYSAPSTDAHRKFNEKHTQTRNCVERCNGVLKQRFRCLSGDNQMRYEPVKLSAIINVCCALHNISIRDNIGEDVNISSTETLETGSQNTVDNETDVNVLREGQITRERIANNFSN